MSKKNLRYIVGIIVVMMVSVLALGGCKKNRDKDKENTGVEGGLQVEESSEGDSIDFEDFLSEDDEDDKKDTDNDGIPDKKDDDNDGVVDNKDDDDDNDGVLDKKDPDHPSNAGTGDNKEESKDDDKEDNKDENVKDDEEMGWGPLF